MPIVNNKRKAKSSGGPSAKRVKSKWSSTKFGQLLDKAGLSLGGDHQQNLLTVDPALFQRQLANEFKKQSADESIIANFMKGFREYVESPTRFKKSLLPTEAAPEAEIRDRFGGLDSLVRLLLGVDVIQPLVADVLLEWLPDYMEDGGDVAVHGIGMGDRLAMPKLILGQMRWLDTLVNGKDLCDKLLEVVEIAPQEMRREIIVALPEILDDPQHNDAAQKLKDLLSTTPGLTAPIVDALSNLNIEKTVAAEVLDAAMGSLQSADICDLPAVLKFIHEYMTPARAQEIASEIRLKINLDFNPLPVISSTPRLTQPKSTKSSDYFVILDTIRTSISFQKGVADGWIKAISAVSKPEDHRVMDVFVLFVLFSISSHRKAVEKMFAGKVRSGCFNAELMDTVFGSHPEALREFFPTLLLLCDSLLSSTSLTVSTFAMPLYQHLFESFPDIYCQQDVVDNLVVHVNNGVKSEVDHALDVILLLLKKHCKIILRFESLIKTALDYLGHLSIQQIRKLYQILATLAFSNLDHTSSLQNEIHTFIRKQLHHFEPRFRHIGVIGSVMTIQQMAGRTEVPDSMSQGSHSSLSTRRQEMAKTLLEEVMLTCSHSEECAVLFSDEMSGVVPCLDHSLLEYLGGQVTEKFQETYLVEIADGVPQKGGVSMDYLYSLDTTDEGSIALSLFPMVVDDRTSGEGREKKEGLVGMASLFRLLRMCEVQLNGNLDGIDALLGCPVLLCSENLFQEDKFECLNEVKRLDICHSLFYCINWFRELVSAFAGESDIDMKGKVIIRLQNITDLQDRLGSCIAVTPSFSPPLLAASETSLSNLAKGKITKADVTLASMTAATVNVDKESTAMDKATPTSGFVDRLLPYFRPLDLSVFKAFHFGCLSRTMLDSDLLTREQEEVKLKVPQLIFLLQDLCGKLTSSFVTFGPKVKSAVGGGESLSFTQSDLVDAMLELTPALCRRLETNSAYFQELVAENDGVVDMVAGGVDHPQYCLVCHLLLKVFSNFFGWSSLNDPKYSQQLRSSLSTIVERISSQAPSSSLQAVAHEACKYFNKFAEFLPTLTCAHALARVVVAICKTCKAAEAKPAISRVCGKMLQHPWQATESSQHRNSAIAYLLKHHIEWAPDCLAVVEVLAGDASIELLGEEAVMESSKYPTLNTNTFPWFYRAMMTALVNQLKSLSQTGRGKQQELDEDLPDKFLTIQLSAKIFSILVDLVQCFSKRPVLAAVLKIGKQYVEMFARYAMPILDVMLRPKKDDVIGVLKTLQKSTRYLQHCCSHSKVAKDTNLINHVPQLKKSLEMLLFRVKGLMASHNCQGAFWVGTLKNRDLKGQEILSQVSQKDKEDGEDEDEEGEEEDSVKSDYGCDDGSTSVTSRGEDEGLI